MEVLINQKAVSPTFTFKKLFIRNVAIVPFENARILVELQFDDSSGLLSAEQRKITKSIEMPTEIYNQWMTDEFLVDYVVIALNLTKQN